MGASLLTKRAQKISQTGDSVDSVLNIISLGVKEGVWCIQTSSLCIGQRLPMLVFYNNFTHCEHLCT